MMGVQQGRVIGQDANEMYRGLMYKAEASRPAPPERATPQFEEMVGTLKDEIRRRDTEIEELTFLLNAANAELDRISRSAHTVAEGYRGADRDPRAVSGGDTLARAR